MSRVCIYLGSWVSKLGKTEWQRFLHVLLWTNNSHSLHRMTNSMSPFMPLKKPTFLALKVLRIIYFHPPPPPPPHFWLLRRTFISVTISRFALSKNSLLNLTVGSCQLKSWAAGVPEIKATDRLWSFSPPLSPLFHFIYLAHPSLCFPTLPNYSDQLPRCIREMIDENNQ